MGMGLGSRLNRGARMMRRTIVLLVVMAVGVLVSGGGVAFGLTSISCAGGGVLCEGTEEDEYIVGTSVKASSFKKGSKEQRARKAERRSRDYILARGGEDIVSSGRGNDVIFGGLGDDELAGGMDDDAITSADGVDGNDVVGCGPGRDRAVVDSADEADASTCEDIVEVEAVDASGVLEDPERTDYAYGTHAITDEASGTRYALSSDEVNLGEYVGERVTVRGWLAPGYEEEEWVGIGPRLVYVYAVEQ